MEIGLYRPAWAEINLSAVAHNMKEIRKIVRPETEIMAVIKANGYGHGAEKIAKTVLNCGAGRLAVATLGEAIKLKRAGIQAPILILGYTPPAQVPLAIDYDITQTVYTLNMAQNISRVAEEKGKQVAVHIKIDTGMGRIGFLPGGETVKKIIQITRMKGLLVEGIYTHFALADHQDKSYTRYQLSKFQEVIAALDGEGIHIPLKHAANSAAIIDMPETHMDMVRPGIIIYGCYPSEEVQKSRIYLMPAMQLKAQVSFVKKIGTGTSISYGRKFIAEKETMIASLPLGYADGYSRLLSNQGYVLIRGHKAPVVGTICMDQFMVDASGISGIKVGDEAVLFGTQGTEKISVEEIAQRLGTINYEILCMVSERIPRIYI
ncbi:MAG: alanine racemase [Bacillota bacterium]|jgi:alanine racemase